MSVIIKNKSTVVGPNIVMGSSSSLILYVDAANQYSYSQNSNVWNDVTPYNRKGLFVSNSALVPAPIFNPSNGGSLDFTSTGNGLIAGYSGSGIDFSSSADFQNLLGTNFTINTWVKPIPNLPGDQYVIAAYRNTSGAIPNPLYNTVFQLMTVGATANPSFFKPYSFIFYFGLGGGTGAITSASYNSNSWYNVVCVRNGSTASLYLNGVFQNSKTETPGVYTGTPRLTLGYAQTVPPPPGSGLFANWLFTGSIASIGIYNRVLSNDEILQNYNALKNRFTS